MKNVLMLLGLTVGCVFGVNAADPVLTGDAARGKSLTVTCAACHGEDGNGPAPFPKLAGQGEKYLLKQLMDIRGGARPVPTMVGQVDNMTDQELADIAAYFAGKTSTGGQTDPDKYALGKKIYLAGVADRKVAACVACHSPTGQGNAPAGFPALAGQHPAYIEDQLRAYRKGYEDPAGRTNDGEIKIMRSTAFGMSDLEIEAVASYISGLK